MVRASFCETTAKAHQLGAPPRWQVKQVLGFDIERVVCGNLHAVWYAAPVVVVPLQVARTLGSVKGRVSPGPAASVVTPFQTVPTRSLPAS